MAELGVEPSQLIEGAYVDLLAKRRGLDCFDKIEP